MFPPRDIDETFTENVWPLAKVTLMAAGRLLSGLMVIVARRIEAPECFGDSSTVFALPWIARTL